MGFRYDGDVALSDDGTVLAVGFRSYNSNTGMVYVFGYQGGTTWTQLGQDLYGAGSQHYNGRSLDLSSDGTILAMGSYKANSNRGKVYVKRFNGSLWVDHGTVLLGSTYNINFGVSVALSSDGNTLAVGAHEDGQAAPGFVTVFVYDSSNTPWAMKGLVIKGEVNGDRFGETVSLSNDGNIVAVGANYASGNTGKVSIYGYDGSNWVLLGNELEGSNVNDRFGISVALSGDGTYLAVGARDGLNANNERPGYVEVYQYISGSSIWSKLGDTIYGVTDGEMCGYSVDISDTGNLLTIGCGATDSNKGKIMLYQNLYGTWYVASQDVPGVADDQFGFRVAISGDGSMYAGFANAQITNSYAKAYSVSPGPPLPIPSIEPSMKPSISNKPSFEPSLLPSKVPSVEPSISNKPSFEPSLLPSKVPSDAPTLKPSLYPSMIPSTQPSFLPSVFPSFPPSYTPTNNPSFLPSSEPSVNPTMKPSLYPSMTSSTQPSFVPSVLPSFLPSFTPTNNPSFLPSSKPSVDPTLKPSFYPSMTSSTQPSFASSVFPSLKPSDKPSFSPVAPTMKPSLYLSMTLSARPSFVPSVLLSFPPSDTPTNNPSFLPSEPSVDPTMKPSLYPSMIASVTSSLSAPSFYPSIAKSIIPSNFVISNPPSTLSLNTDFPSRISYLSSFASLSPTTIVEQDLTLPVSQKPSILSTDSLLIEPTSTSISNSQYPSIESTIAQTVNLQMVLNGVSLSSVERNLLLNEIANIFQSFISEQMPGINVTSATVTVHEPGRFIRRMMLTSTTINIELRAIRDQPIANISQTGYTGLVSSIITFLNSNSNELRDILNDVLPGLTGITIMTTSEIPTFSPTLSHIPSEEPSTSNKPTSLETLLTLSIQAAVGGAAVS